MNTTVSIPVKYADLIIRYSHNLLSEAEEKELEDWITTSDENLEIYEELTGELDNKIFDPHELISDTDDLLDTWMVAGLIARQMEDIITPDEKRILDIWKESSETNKTIYNSFTNKSNLHQFIVWMKQFRRGKNSPELN